MSKPPKLVAVDPAPLREAGWPLVAAVAIAAGVALRLAYFAAFPDWVTGFDDHNWTARALLFDLGGVNDAWRAPGETLFVGAILRLTNEKFAAVRLAHTLLMCGWLPLVWLLARRMLPRRTALGALTLAAFWPEFFVYGNLVLTEALSGFLMLASLCWLLPLADGEVAKTRRALAAALAAGLAWGGVALTRDTFLYLAVPAALWLAIPWGAEDFRLPRWRAGLALAFAVGVALPVGAWTARNAWRFDGLITISHNGAYNFMVAWSGMGREEVRDAYFAWPEKEKASRAMAAALDGVAHRPGAMLARIADNLPQFFMPDGMTMRVWQHPSLPPTFGGGALLTLWLAMAVGVLAMWLGLAWAGMALQPWRRVGRWRAEPALVLLALVCAGLFAMHALVWMQPRYRITVTPLLIVLALYGWGEARALRREARRALVGTAGAVAIVFAIAQVAARHYYLAPLIARGTVADEFPADNKLPELMLRHYATAAQIAQRQAKDLLPVVEAQKAAAGQPPAPRSE